MARHRNGRKRLQWDVRDDVKKLLLKYVVNRTYEEEACSFTLRPKMRNRLRTGRRRVCSQLSVKPKISQKVGRPFKS